MDQNSEIRDSYTFRVSFKTKPDWFLYGQEDWLPFIEVDGKRLTFPLPGYEIFAHPWPKENTMELHFRHVGFDYPPKTVLYILNNKLRK